MSSLRSPNALRAVNGRAVSESKGGGPRTGRFARACLLAAAFAAQAPAARAAGADEPKPTVEAKRSEELAGQAFELYKKNQFADAITLYMRAYQLAPAGVLLFNVAKIYDQKLQDRAQAVEHYRRAAAATDLDPELTKRSRERAAALQGEIDAQQHQTAPAPRVGGAPAEPAPDAPDPGAPLRIGGLIAAGVGVVGLGIGTVFGLNAIGKNKDAEKLCTGNACEDGRALTLTKESRDAATLSTVSFAVGGVLLVGGLGAFFLAPGKPAAAAPASGGRPRPPSVGWASTRVAPAVGTQGGGLVFAGRWL